MSNTNLTKNWGELRPSETVRSKFLWHSKDESKEYINIVWQNLVNLQGYITFTRLYVVIYIISLNFSQPIFNITEISLTLSSTPGGSVYIEINYQMVKQMLSALLSDISLPPISFFMAYGTYHLFITFLAKKNHNTKDKYDYINLSSFIDHGRLYCIWEALFKHIFLRIGLPVFWI